MRGVLAVAIAVAALFLGSLTADAPASPTWLAPARLSAGGASSEKPQVAVDGGGDALAVWERPDAETAKTVIEAAARPAGSGPWHTAQIISSKKLTASDPVVAVDAAGDATVVWLSYDGSEYSYLEASRQGPAGAWSAPVTLQSVGATPAIEPRPGLAIDSGGAAVVLWERPSGAAAVVEAASRSTPAGAFSAPEALTKEAEEMHPAVVGIDAGGSATAVWEERGTPVRIDAAERPAGGKWQPAVSVSGAEAEGNANVPRLAVDGQGQAVAVWEQFNGELGEIVEAASRPGAKATWSKASEITNPHVVTEPGGQQVAIDGQGHAVVTWSWLDGGHDLVEASVGSATTATWGAPVALSAPAGAVEEMPQPGVDERGDAIVVWEQWSGARKVIEAAAGSALTGSWHPAVTLSAEGEEADEQVLALDPQGNAAALWRRFDGSFYEIEGAGFDAAGPALNGLSLPSSGLAGLPLGFAVSPFDSWSALGVIGWSFGDGATATGPSVTHAYASPGSYTVTVTAADAVGNTTSAAATLAIGAPAPLISGATLSHRRFRVGSHPTAVSARTRPPAGTSFHFSLNETAGVRIAFTRAAAGRRSHGRCVAPTAGLRTRHARRCTRTVSLGALSRADLHAGGEAIAFSGRIGRRALSPGAYRASITASAFGRTSAPVALSFDVVH
jgi:hypothetical protein